MTPFSKSQSLGVFGELWVWGHVTTSEGVLRPKNAFLAPKMAKFIWKIQVFGPWGYSKVKSPNILGPNLSNWTNWRLGSDFWRNRTTPPQTQPEVPGNGSWGGGTTPDGRIAFEIAVRMEHFWKTKTMGFWPRNSFQLSKIRRRRFQSLQSSKTTFPL